MTLLKGALVAYTPTFLVPVPNVTVFQYNPETLTHVWHQPDRAAMVTQKGTESGTPLAVSGVPTESFSLTILLDSNQDIADNVPASAQLAEVSGLYTRIAALEMLMYPVAGDGTSQLLGQASSALGLGVTSGSSPPTSAASTPSAPPNQDAVTPGSGDETAATTDGQQNGTSTAPTSNVPLVLFVWGIYRIVPVRVTALTITEKLYDELLNPIQAEVQVSMDVLTPQELSAAAAQYPVIARIAGAAYTYTFGQRQLDALANLGNSLVPAALSAIT